MSYRILRRKPLLLAVLAVFGVVLASCSGTTDPATNVTQTTAKLNAHVGCDGGNTKSYNGTAGEPCSFYFRLRKAGDSVWTGTARQPNGDPAQGVNAVASNVPASADVTGLDPATQYEYEVCGRGDATHADTCPSQSGAATTKFTTQAAGDPDNQPVPSAPSGWDRVGAEGFTADGSGLPSSFTQYPSTWKDTSKQGTYGCQMGPSTSGGNLHYRLAGGLVCAPVFKTQGGTGNLSNGMPAGMTEGRYSVRFRVRNGASSAHKIAWLLWPDSDVWEEGEIDFPEVSTFPAEVDGFLHHPAPHPVVGGHQTTIADDQDSYESGVTVGSDNAWHTATVERRSGSVKFFIDGNLLGTSVDRLPSKAMHWVLQSETRVNSTSVPAMSEITDVDIDWVSVDKPSGITPPPPPVTQCNDGVDNADPEDTLVDLADPGCTSSTDDDETNSPPPPPPPGGTVYSAVGDFCGGSCGSVASLVKGWNVYRHIGLGDYQYSSAGSGGSTFKSGYETQFAGLHGITLPTFGSTHDTDDGSGSWEGYAVSFFNANGAPEIRGQLSDHQRGVSYDLPDGWHVIDLNYNNQDNAWVQSDLAGRTNKCVIAQVHAPVYGSSSSEHPTNQAAGFASALQAGGADLYLQGHQHFYERLNVPSGTALTVGTGGIGPYTRTSTASGSVFYRSGTYGAVKLTLAPNSWKSEFISTSGTVIDTAQGNCAD